MLTRRQVLALGALAVTGLGGCASAGSDVVTADVPRRAPDPAAVGTVVDAVGAFSIDLLGAVASAGDVVCSPFSVLVALAMVRNGATGQTARQMDTTLHLPDLRRLNAGLNAIDQTLAARAGHRRTAAGERVSVALDLANRVWGQRDEPWKAGFLTALASWYGTGVGQVDIAADPEAARRRVNAWVEDETHGRITDLMPAGSITALTRLVLANALHVKAPWDLPFEPSGSRPFHAPAGAVDVPMMDVSLDAAGTVGPGWQAARIPLAGRELALTVILPRGDLDDLRRSLKGPGLARLLRAGPRPQVALTMPRLQLRSTFALKPVLIGLGMSRAFSDAAELDAMTTAEPLKLGVVEHQGWISVDEHGLEAAAATGVTVEATSGRLSPPVQLVLDRPFLACVHDVATALPLLVVQVTDPSGAPG